MPIIDVKATGDNIKNFMAEKGISVTEMQEILGFANGQAIYKWFRGDSLPKIDNLVILASALDKTVNDILVIRE